MSQTARYSAAAHEAGHAVVAWALGLPLGELRVDIDDDERVGEAKIGSSDALPVIDRIAVCFAGIEAQEILQTEILDFAGMSDHVAVLNILSAIEAGEDEGLRLRQAGRTGARELLLAHEQKLFCLSHALAASGHLRKEEVIALLSDK